MALRYLQPFNLSGLKSVIVVMTVLCLAPAMAFSGADKTNFPAYDEIKTNIAFWEKVYATYSINTAILHDQNVLSRIYTTVSLLDKSIPGARKQNEKLIEKEKEKYRKLLLGLAAKKQPVTSEEKRIAKLFGNHYSSSALKEASTNIRTQTGLKERFTEGVTRSGAYMSTLKKLFRDHQLPEDLAYLPHVESSFNPKAFSKFGAAGMWQFTRSTGKEFLRIDYIIDERRDPILSADAAARLLKKNYSLLGSWPLALTAYNYGAAGMKRALNQEGSYQKIFLNYRKGHFKFASRNFYSEFLAAVKVAKQQAASNKITFNKPRNVVKVKLPAYTNTAKLCSYLGISSETLQEYNPSLRPPVFEGTKYIPENYVLNLPYRYKNSNLLAGAPSSIFHREQKRSQFYQVKPGDTAGAIALAHNISLSNLIKANHLTRTAMIRVGQNLRIPSNGKSQYIKQLHPSLEAVSEVVLKDNKKTLPNKPEPVFDEDAAVSGNLIVTDIKKRNNLVTGKVEVQPEESIGVFADWLKVTPEAIRLTNNIRADKDVFPGQMIILEFINVTTTNFEAVRFDFHQETQEDFFTSYSIIGMKTYQVVKGDTAWDLCYKKFDLPLWLLKKYNDRMDFNRLESSSSLQIPILKEI